MNKKVLAEDFQIVRLAGTVDLNDAALNTDVVSLRLHQAVDFVISVNSVGGGASSTVTVTACDDRVPTNETAIPFDYYTIDEEEIGAKQSATAQGVALDDDLVVVIHVSDNMVGKVDGRAYVRLRFTDAGAAMDASILAFFSGNRYAGSTQSANPSVLLEPEEEDES